ncbi:MAG: Histidinol-phosphatase [alternative form], partial [uncultured Rubrobacteraceae bacterium]
GHERFQRTPRLCPRDRPTGGGAAALPRRERRRDRGEGPEGRRHRGGPSLRKTHGGRHPGALSGGRHPVGGAGGRDLRYGTDLAAGPGGRHGQLHEGEPHVLRLRGRLGGGAGNPRRRGGAPHRGPLPRQPRGWCLQGDRRADRSPARQRHEEPGVCRRRRGPLAARRRQGPGARPAEGPLRLLAAAGPGERRHPGGLARRRLPRRLCRHPQHRLGLRPNRPARLRGRGPGHRPRRLPVDDRLPGPHRHQRCRPRRGSGGARGRL